MQYLICICQKSIADYTMMNSNGTTGLARVYVPSTSPDISDHAELYRYTGEEFSRYTNILFAQDESSAKTIANELARANPGKQVYYSKLLGAFECVPGDPVEKAISAKGTLPV